jgi:hypothetical protein
VQFVSLVVPPLPGLLTPPPLLLAELSLRVQPLSVIMPPLLARPPPKLAELSVTVQSVSVAAPRL